MYIIKKTNKKKMYIINIVNNNVLLSQIESVLHPFLSYLNLDLLDPNTLKMLILTFIILTAN